MACTLPNLFKILKTTIPLRVIPRKSIKSTKEMVSVPKTEKPVNNFNQILEQLSKLKDVNKP